MNEAKASSKDSPLPAGWLEEYFDKVDFEHSFAGLRGIKHFYIEAWKGRIRSEQCRFEAAWRHFDKAYKLSEGMEETIPNLVRQFILNIWCFQNALAEAPLEHSEEEVQEAWIPELPEEVLNEYPEVRLVIRMRKASEALLRLHLGHYNDAAEIYQDLIEEAGNDEEGMQGSYYLGLAASEHNLGFEDRAKRSLENSGLTVLTTGRPLVRLKTASALHAFYKFLKNEEEAGSWLTFLQRFECPPPTREVFVKRANLLLERMVARTQLLVLS